MKINQTNALKLWEERYGNAHDIKDYTGRTIQKAHYGNNDIMYGWNINHKLPTSKGGSNSKLNLEIASIYVNSIAEDKTTYQIDDNTYQIKEVDNPEYGIFLLDAYNDEVERVDYHK